MITKLYYGDMLVGEVGKDDGNPSPAVQIGQKLDLPGEVVKYKVWEILEDGAIALLEITNE